LVRVYGLDEISDTVNMSLVVTGKVALEHALKEDAVQLAKISKRAFHSDIHVGAPITTAGDTSSGGGPIGYDSPEFQVRMMKICQYYKMTYDGQLVGGLITGRKRLGHYELERIFVDPDYHNRGIATNAFNQVIAMVSDAQIWTLGTPEWNVRTKHFYEKLGFMQIGWTMDEPAWRGRYYEKVMDPSQPYARTRIGELTPGMRDIEVEAKVLEISATRQVQSRATGQPLKVADALLSDETGTIKLALWNDQIRQVKAHDTIRINKGYVTSFRGQKQLSVSRYNPLIILV
jgi:replication factor A1